MNKTQQEIHPLMNPDTQINIDTSVDWSNARLSGTSRWVPGW